MKTLLSETLLSGQVGKRVPFWFMRQAGRYLPEYKAIRKEQKNFLEFCYTPDAATEVTLQPLRRFHMDAAIIFSDILVIPHAMGMQVTFVEKSGPQLVRLESPEEIEKLELQAITSFLGPVYKAIKKTRSALDAEKDLIGFCGSPWTLACYMLEGGGSKQFEIARTFAYAQPKAFAVLLEKLSQAIVLHLSAQIEAGANVVQLFDSWAGVVPAAKFDAWVVAPTRAIVSQIKEKYPHVPVIGFARGAGSNIVAYAHDTGIHGVGIDQGMSMQWAAEHIPAQVALQGNLDPVLLMTDIEETLKEAKHILSVCKDRALVFNLGHGVIQHTPVEHVQRLSDFLVQE